MIACSSSPNPPRATRASTPLWWASTARSRYPTGGGGWRVGGSAGGCRLGGSRRLAGVVLLGAQRGQLLLQVGDPLGSGGGRGRLLGPGGRVAHAAHARHADQHQQRAGQLPGPAARRQPAVVVGVGARAGPGGQLLGLLVRPLPRRAAGPVGRGPRRPHPGRGVHRRQRPGQPRGGACLHPRVRRPLPVAVRPLGHHGHQAAGGGAADHVHPGPRRGHRPPAHRQDHRGDPAGPAGRAAGPRRAVVVVGTPFLITAAFLAGLVSFSSPCCLPLLPGYVAYVSGDVGAQRRAGRTMAAAVLFTVGFGATFTTLGATASWLGAALLAGRPALVRAAGVLVVAVGALTVVGAEPRVLAGERRLLALHRVPQGPRFAAPLGAAAATSTAAAGAGLLAVYSAGLAVPFLGLAWAVARGQGRGGGAGLLGRHHRLLARVGGTLLVVMGVAMVAGWWTQLFAPLVRWFARSGWPPI